MTEDATKKIKSRKNKKTPFAKGADSLFSIASFLYKGLGVEHRDGQLKMIEHLCDTCEQAARRRNSLEGRRELETKGHLPVEVRLGQVPTGTGKSMAVILTAMAAWLKGGLNSIIATHTHVLQDQLMSKDFPFIKSRLTPLLGEEILEGWRSVLVKGLENYPCRLRMESLYSAALATPGKTLLVHGKYASDVAVVMAGKIDEIRLSMKNKSFELAEDDPLFPLIRSSRDRCAGEECPFKNHCSYKALMRIRAPFIVTNHAYLLSCIRAIKEGGAAEENATPEGEGAKEATVSPFRGGELYFFDEAHHLMGYRALGKTLNSVSLRNMEKILSFAVPGNNLSLFRGEGQRRKDFLEEARAVLLSPAESGSTEKLEQLLAGWRSSVESVPGACGSEIREACAAAAVWSGEIRSFKEAEALTEGEQGVRKLVSEDAVSLVEEGEANLLEDMKEALPNLQSVFCFSGTLFTKKQNMDGEGEGAAFSAETGLVPTLPSFSTDSPFNFEAVRVWVPERSPLGISAAPEANTDSPFETPIKRRGKSGRREKEASHDEFVERFCRTYIPPYLKEELGGVLVLCSSKARMDRIARAVAEEMESRGLPRWLVMKQGERAKKALAKSFVRASSSAALFGSASFREGFDVRGRGLTWVIIDRLPFSVPGSEEMLKIKKLKEWGYIENEFLHGINIMKFHLEQAAGRLIRTEKDWGTITLLDSRILTTGSRWGCEKCFPVERDNWYLDLPSEDEWIEMSKNLEEKAAERAENLREEAGVSAYSHSPRLSNLFAENSGESGEKTLF